MRKYDFAVSWDKNECLFTDTLKSDCKNKGLSFIRITEKTVRPITRALETGKMRINVILDTEATYDIPREPYTRLNYAVKDSGGVVINDPDRTRIAVDKSVMHYELMDAEIPTPYTVVLRNWEPKTFKLSNREKNLLGEGFIIKPACGWGHQGVLYDAKGTIQEIAKARGYDPNDNFLLQERVTPARLNGKKAWFRIFHIFNKIIPCWWDDATGRYEYMTLEEFRKYHLSPIVKYVAKIGGITKMVWFSTEIAIDKKPHGTRFVAIDYVNDQCDMESKSESKDGVPNEIVRFTAYSIVHASSQIIKRKRIKFDKKYTVLFHRAGRLGMKGLGYAPFLLVPK